MNNSHRTRESIMTADPDWMPVFFVVEHHGVAHVAHPDHRQPLPAAYRDEMLQRIGTARRKSNGSFTITLKAIPLSGRLFMRPPLPTEIAHGWEARR